MEKLSLLKEQLDKANISYSSDSSLANYTTLGVGGNVSLLSEVQDGTQLEKAVRLAIKLNVPFLLIGKGSNIIISDNGFKGFAIINKSHNYEILETKQVKSKTEFKSSTGKKNEISDYDESKYPDIIVRVDSGIQVRNLANALYHNGVIGLQWFVGIPATVGGAIYMNMHGGSYFFGDLVHKVKLLSDSTIKEVDKNYFDFDYDYSILHKTKEIILWAELILKKGDVQKAQEIGKKWANIKSFQPQRSAGCIFQNLTDEQQKKLNLPTPSIGYVIDKILKLSGTQIGDAVISTRHAAFIENTGKAKAKDIFKLIQMIKNKAKDELGIDLQLEVELIGSFE
jgi:UDP-N-acetylmuramate dehydrogenase